MLNRLHGRTAVVASPGWNLFKTLVQLVVFWTTFLALLPYVVYACESLVGCDAWRFAGPAARSAGVALFLTASGLGLSSAVAMALVGRGTPLPADCPRALVIAGPYRYLRNPMALAGISQGVAVGLAVGSPAIVLYALSGAFVWNYFVRPWEERDLAERFGAPYLAYREAVPCWRWRLSPYRAADPRLDARHDA